MKKPIGGSRSERRCSSFLLFGEPSLQRRSETQDLDSSELKKKHRVLVTENEKEREIQIWRGSEDKLLQEV